MIFGLVAAAILIPLIQAFRSDWRGYMAALEKWKAACAIDPITCGTKPKFDWELCVGRLIDGGIAAVLLVVTAIASTSGVENLDRAAIETIVREINAAHVQPTSQPVSLSGGAQ